MKRYLPAALAALMILAAFGVGLRYVHLESVYGLHFEGVRLGK